LTNSAVPKPGSKEYSLALVNGLLDDIPSPSTPISKSFEDDGSDGADGPKVCNPFARVRPLFIEGSPICTRIISENGNVIVYTLGSSSVSVFKLEDVDSTTDLYSISPSSFGSPIKSFLSSSFPTAASAAAIMFPEGRKMKRFVEGGEIPLNENVACLAVAEIKNDEQRYSSVCLWV
jgi:hypothetical protein